MFFYCKIVLSRPLCANNKSYILALLFFYIACLHQKYLTTFYLPFATDKRTSKGLQKKNTFLTQVIQLGTRHLLIWLNPAQLDLWTLWAMYLAQWTMYCTLGPGIQLCWIPLGNAIKETSSIENDSLNLLHLKDFCRVFYESVNYFSDGFQSIVWQIIVDFHLF